MLDELMKQYQERFGDTFPLMCCICMSTGEIVDEIRRCLDSGKPFVPFEDVDY